LVINLELPWNPMRLEQRIGRVDRIGQGRTVHVVHLIARNSGESQLLSRLQLRVARAHADIGGADPLDNESVVARLVIGGDAANGPHVDEAPGVPQMAGRLWTPPLTREGEAEANRTARARTFIKSGDETTLARVEALGPCIARARHWQTRRYLGGRRLMLWRVVAEDGCGAAAASAMVAVLVNKGRRHDEEELLLRVDQAAAAWRESVAANHRAFISTRLVREHALDAARQLSDSARSSEPFQPGLFERRSERARLAVAVAQAAADRDRAERLMAMEQSVMAAFLPPHLLLVLEA
jgi:hypothetical protein